MSKVLRPRGASLPFKHNSNLDGVEGCRPGDSLRPALSWALIAWDWRPLLVPLRYRVMKPLPGWESFSPLHGRTQTQGQRPSSKSPHSDLPSS